MIEHLRRMGYVVAIALMCGFAVVQLAGDNGIPALLAKRKQLRELEDQNRALELGNQELRKANEGLRSNPDVQKRAVRESLGLLSDGEEVFHTGGDPGKPVAPPKDGPAH